MTSSDNRRRTAGTIALRVLSAGLGVLLTVLLLILAIWHSEEVYGGSLAPSPAEVREHNVLWGATLSCLIASLLLVLGPLAGWVWPRLRHLPGVGYVTVVGFALVAGLLILVEEFRTVPFGWVIIAVALAFAALAWWLRWSDRRSARRSGDSLHQRT